MTPKNRNGFIRANFRALVGPRHTWRLAYRARRLAADFPSRLREALARTSEEVRFEGGRPVFLLSAGWRSGSTLLQRMIMDSNKDILVWGEPFPNANIHDGLVNQFRAFTSEWPPSPYFLSNMNLREPSDIWVANLYPDVDDLVRAHRRFYDALFAEPARRAGWKNWGIKEVRLRIEHATYLRALYPRCKIILLYRKPHDAYISYNRWNLAITRTWPDSFIYTPYEFGRMWAQMTRGFLDGHKKVDAFLIRYEDLDDRTTVSRLEAYLGWPVPLASKMRLIREPDYARSSRKLQRKSLLRVERMLLNLTTRSVLRDAGY